MKSLIPLTLILLSGVANAETLFPMPSVPDVTDGDGWAFALGAEIEYGAEYDGSDVSMTRSSAWQKCVARLARIGTTGERHA